MHIVDIEDGDRDEVNGMKRLQNWARWSNHGVYKMILKHAYPTRAAVCGEYSRHNPEYQPDHPKVPIDVLDAERVERALLRMPAQNRHAVVYMYTGKVPACCVYKLASMPGEQITWLVRQSARLLSDIERMGDTAKGK